MSCSLIDARTPFLALTIGSPSKVAGRPFTGCQLFVRCILPVSVDIDRRREFDLIVSRKFLPALLSGSDSYRSPTINRSLEANSNELSDNRPTFSQLVTGVSGVSKLAVH